MSPRRREAWAAAGAAFGIVAALAYFAMRLFEQRSGIRTSPLLLLAELHTGYYWRVAISLWWGALGGYLGFFLHRPLLRAFVGAPPAERSASVRATPRRSAFRGRALVVGLTALLLFLAFTYP